MSVELLPEDYDTFRPIVDALKSGQADAEYLGSGAESTVWKVKNEVSDFVIKLANEFSVRGRPRDTCKATESKIRAGVKGLGVAGLEQILAASPQEGVSVWEYINATSLQYAPEELMQQVTPTQIENLWQTVLVSSHKGIIFDGWNDCGGNVFYNKTSGFTIIDYWSTKQPVSFENNRKYVARSMGAYGLRFT